MPGNYYGVGMTHDGEDQNGLQCLKPLQSPRCQVISFSFCINFQHIRCDRDAYKSGHFI